MDEFRAALGQYLVGSLDVAGLEAAIDRAVAEQEDAAPQLVAMLDELYQSGRLPHQILALLKRRILSNQRLESAADDAADEATRFQMPAEPPQGPMQVPGGGPAGSQVPQDSAAGDDATRFQPPPVRPPDSANQTGPGADQTGQTSETGPYTGQTTGQSVPYTGQTGPFTGQTGPFTGQTGPLPGQGPGTQTGAQTGAPTGAQTGAPGAASNWSHPSQWTGGGGPPGQTIEIGSVIKERFVLEDMIGQGGMGKVFKARDLRKEEAQDRNPFVAIKILNEDFKRHPQALQALQREARKAQDLAHPNIVFVGDFDRDGDNVFMQMELLEGEALDDLNKRHSMRGLPFEDALPLIQGLAAGLSHAHKKGVVHSDFKPANAFLTNAGVIKIFDFGIARAAKRDADLEGDKTLFDAGELGALTPAYASCEMIEGGDPDPRDDIYALAVVAYELLAGSHPFDRKSAVKARDAKMTPKPVRGITGRQWRALNRGLAFDRDGRSPSVDDFMEGINPRSLLRPGVVGAAVGGVALVIVIGVLGPQILEQRTIDSLIGTIVAGPDVAITARLGELRALPQDQRRDVLEATQEQFIGYYTGQIRTLWNPQDQRLDYPDAFERLQELLVFFPDSRQVGALESVLIDEREFTIGELYNELDDLRGRGLLIADQAPRNLVGALEDLRRIDPTDEKLSDDQIPIGFANVARANLESDDLVMALEVVEQGLALYPDDTNLRNLMDTVSEQRTAREREFRVAELVKDLGNITALPESSVARAAIATRVRELDRLDDQNLALTQVRQRLDRDLAVELDALVVDRRFDDGRDLLEQFSGVASNSFISARMDGLVDAAEGYFAELEQLEAALSTAISEDRLDGAVAGTAIAVLQQLEEFGAGERLLNDGRVQLAEAYAGRALRHRNAEQWDDARTALAAGMALDVPRATVDRLGSELARVDQFEAIAQESAEGERQNLMAAQRAEEVERLQQDFGQRLIGPTFSAADARGAMAVLGTLAEYDAAPEGGSGRIADRFITEIDTLKQRGDWEDALLLAEQAVTVLPDEARLLPVVQQIRSENSARIAQLELQRVAEAQANVRKLLDDPRLDQDWHEDLREQLNRYAAIAGEDEPAIAETRELVAQMYVADARRLRADDRLAIASQQLERAEELSSELPALQSERAELATQQVALQEQQQAREQQAEIDGLKLNLTAEANRGRVGAARSILDRLKERIPDDDFVLTEGPERIAQAYVGLARKQLEADSFDDAENLADSAASLVPGLPTLGTLRVDIAAAREAFVAPAVQPAPSTDRRALEGIANALISDQQLNSAQIAEYLGGIRTSDPELYRAEEPVMVRRVIQTLDQWASVDRARATKRLADVRSIFPTNAALADYQLPGAPARAVAQEDPCANPGLVGKGSNRRASCRDALAADKRGPAMVVIPKGGPFSAPVAFSKYEVTIRDYNLYCELSGSCSALPGKPALPVTGISIQDAEAFVEWLGVASGARYRIPNSQEWEYAANAGGQQPPRNFNCQVRQNNVLIKGVDLMPVNTGDANGWGLKNYVGNAQEWVRAGSGWAVRGGAYTNSLIQCSISLNSSHSGEADRVTGFRVMREVG